VETLDFTVPSISIRAVWPQIVLVATALCALIVDVFKRKEKSTLVGYISLAGSMFATACLLMAWPADGISTFSGMFFTDGFSFFVNLTILLVLVLTIMITINYQKFFERINCGEYYALLLFATCGMTLVAGAGNLILIFVALETMSISIYALAAFHKDQLRSTESALKYFLIGAFASCFLLYGFALIFGATGTLDIVRIGNFILSQPDVMHSKFIVAGLAMTTIGLGFKVSIVPFHMWTPDVYEGAPTVITGYMASALKVAAFAALIRVVLVPFLPLKEDWSTLMWVAALLTMTVGNIIALAQEDIKRMLAYSGIAHAGYILIGFVTGTSQAQAGMLYYILAYAFMNIGAFGVVSLLVKEGEEYTKVSDFAGVGFKHPLMGLGMSIFMLSLAGIPPSAGFMGKFFIFSEAIKAGYVWLAIFGALNSILSIYYYLRVLNMMFFYPSDERVSVTPPSVITALALAIAGGYILVMGIFPASFLSFAGDCIFTIMIRP
jgi:NADH-quinone oxidoreductase subunit N